MLRIPNLLLFLIFLPGCSDEQNNAPEPNSQADLAEDISVRTGMAMLVYDLIESELIGICELSTDETSFAPDSMIEEWIWRCGFLQRLWDQTEIHRNLINDGTEIEGVVYSFNVYYSEGGAYNYFSESSYGLFTELEVCTSFEIEAHEHGIPTKKCEEWVHMFANLEDDLAP